MMRTLMMWLAWMVGWTAWAHAPAFGQGSPSLVDKVIGDQEAAKWYISWGYNRSAYTQSNVHIRGMGANGPFDLTFASAKAQDMPERFQPKVYFHPGLFTIPQFDVRVARAVGGGWKLGLGWDHMKYKLSDQTLSASGHAAAGDLAMAGVTDALALDPEAQMHMTEGELPWADGFNFEHSDGVNFVRVSLEREHPLFARGSRGGALNAFVMGSAGLAVCSTDFTWAGERTKNKQHVSGFGASVHGGLRLYGTPRLFVQTTAQAGVLSLPWIRIQGAGDAAADQRFGFAEFAFAVGYAWN